uniref:VPS10 domain-containing protein n=1 Tax=Parastrongyloides trichosuri TaxID=131310 RepID=A0A0N4ZB28_PARTI
MDDITKVGEFKKWDNPSAQFETIVVGKYLFFFESKLIEQPTVGWSHFITHRGGNFAIFDIGNKIFIETGKDKLEGIESDELSEEALFACDKNLYMLLYKKFGGVSFNKLYKFNLTSFSWELFNSLAGDVELKSEHENISASVVIAKGCKDNKIYSIVSMDGNVVLFCIDIVKGTVEKLINHSKEKNNLRIIVTEALYHKGIVDCFGGTHGCGFMYLYNNMLRFTVETKDSEFKELPGDGLVGISIGPLAFAQYIESKDLFVVGKGWSNGAGKSRIRYNGDVWVLEEVSTESPRWRKLCNGVPQIGEQGTNYFADVNTVNNSIYHGSLEDGISQQVLNFNDASEVVKKMCSPFNDIECSVKEFRLYDKLIIFKEDFIYTSNMSLPITVIRKDNKIFIFDLIKNTLESGDGYDIKGIDCHEELYESAFVSQNELYLALFNVYGNVTFEFLYKLNTIEYKWDLIYKNPFTEKKEENSINNLKRIIEIDGVSYGNKYYVVHGSETYSLFELDILKNEFYSVCSTTLEGGYTKPVSGVAFGDYVYVIYGYEGCGFRWHKDEMLCFDLVKRDGKRVEIKNSDESPHFSFIGSLHHQLVPYKGYWLQMTGSIQQGMCDSVFDGSIHAIDFSDTEGPSWKRFKTTIKKPNYCRFFVFYDEMKQRVVFGHPKIGLFEQTLTFEKA